MDPLDPHVAPQIEGESVRHPVPSLDGFTPSRVTGRVQIWTEAGPPLGESPVHNRTRCGHFWVWYKCFQRKTLSKYLKGKR